MRPTQLRFRSPKERTGEYVYPLITNEGRHTDYSDSKKSPTLRTTFGTGQRFTHITEYTCRTSKGVGPGTYNSAYNTNKRISAKIARDTYIKDQVIDYMYVGDSILKLAPQWRPGTRDVLTKSIWPDPTPCDRFLKTNSSMLENIGSYGSPDRKLMNKSFVTETDNSKYYKSADKSRSGSAKPIERINGYHHVRLNSLENNGTNQGHYNIKNQIQHDLEIIKKMNERSLLLQHKGTSNTDDTNDMGYDDLKSTQNTRKPSRISSTQKAHIVEEESDT